MVSTAKGLGRVCNVDYPPETLGGTDLIALARKILLGKLRGLAQNGASSETLSVQGGPV
jgi:hypothetical protein